MAKTGSNMKSAVLVALLMWLCSCEKKEKVHVFRDELPPYSGKYLTYIQIQKIIPGDTAYDWRWEVLEFHYGNGEPKWNTLHLNDWNVYVSHWTELPETPDFGLNFEIHFDKPKHHGEPKDSIYGVSYFPYSNTDAGCGCAAWVDRKRNAIYKIAWGDSLYYVTYVKHK